MKKKSYQQTNEPPIQEVQEPAVAYQGIRANEISCLELNPAQLHLLKMLSFVKSEESFLDLKKVLREFYIQQVEKEADEYWTEGKISDELLDVHFRTPYK